MDTRRLVNAQCCSRSNLSKRLDFGPVMIPLSELLADHQDFHSDLQMDSFITLRSGGTLYGCYRQALRELDTRTTALIQRYESRKLLHIDIRELETDRVDPWESERDTVRLAGKRMILDRCDAVIADTEREFLRFYRQAISIRAALESQGVSFPLDGETRDRLDREMWEHQIKCMATIDFMSAGRLQQNTIAMLQSCPPEMRRRLADAVLNRDAQCALVEWYLTYEPEMPPPAVIEEADVRRLIGCESSPSFELAGNS
jgi:hypothetical protein